MTVPAVIVSLYLFPFQAVPCTAAKRSAKGEARVRLANGRPGLFAVCRRTPLFLFFKAFGPASGLFLPERRMSRDFNGMESRRNPSEDHTIRRWIKVV